MEVDSINGYGAALVCIPAAKPAETAQPGPAKAAEDSANGKDSNPTVDSAEKNPSKPDHDREERIADSAMRKAVEEVNKKLAGVRSEAQISVHKETHMVMVKVINADTKQVIREIPPEKTLDAVAKMWEMAGLLLDEKR